MDEFEESLVVVSLGVSMSFTLSEFAVPFTVVDMLSSSQSLSDQLLSFAANAVVLRFAHTAMMVKNATSFLFIVLVSFSGRRDACLFYEYFMWLLYFSVA